MGVADGWWVLSTLKWFTLIFGTCFLFGYPVSVDWYLVQDKADWLMLLSAAVRCQDQTEALSVTALLIYVFIYLFTILLSTSGGDAESEFLLVEPILWKLLNVHKIQ